MNIYRGLVEAQLRKHKLGWVNELPMGVPISIELF